MIQSLKRKITIWKEWWRKKMLSEGAEHKTWISGVSFAQQKQWFLPIITPVVQESSAAPTSPAKTLMSPVLRFSWGILRMGKIILKNSSSIVICWANPMPQIQLPKIRSQGPVLCTGTGILHKNVFPRAVWIHGLYLQGFHCSVCLGLGFFSAFVLQNLFGKVLPKGFVLVSVLRWIPLQMKVIVNFTLFMDLYSGFRLISKCSSIKTGEQTS